MTSVGVRMRERGFVGVVVGVVGVVIGEGVDEGIWRFLSILRVKVRRESTLGSSEGELAVERI